MAQARVDFKANTTGFQKGIKSVKSSIKSVAATVGTIVAPLAALVGAAAVLGTAFKAVSLAADMEATETSFATLLGSMKDAKELLADISKEAKSTPSKGVCKGSRYCCWS